MLSVYTPPPYLAACSQGAWLREDGPMLVRNYDYSPSRFEGVIWSTRMLERRVIGMSDCLWGLLDGMNDAGLGVSLTFGGRRVLGDGFGIPIVVRYLLETCDDVAGARETLARLPYSLSHNLTLVDRRGGVLTAYLAPDRAPIFRRPSPDPRRRSPSLSGPTTAWRRTDADGPTPDRHGRPSHGRHHRRRPCLREQRRRRRAAPRLRAARDGRPGADGDGIGIRAR